MNIKHLLLSVALVFACAAPSMTQEVGKIESKYDRFDDKTTVQLDFMKVAGGKFDGVYLNAVYQCQGNLKSCKPDKVLLGALIVLKGASYDLPGNLTVLADGERLPLGTMVNLGTLDFLPQFNIKGTSLAIAVPFDTYVKIVIAKKVEMRLDILEFELKDAHRKALLLLTAQMLS